MAVQETRRRGFRMWRLALKSIALLSIVIVVLVYASRLSDSYVCLQIGRNAGFNGQGVGLLDLNRDIYVPDMRITNAFFGQQSPNHNLIAVAQYNPQTKTQDLSIRSTTNDSPPIILQTTFPGGGGNFGRGFARVTWSPDSKRLAYLWTDRDRNLNLSVVNADGNNKQTVSLGRSDTGQSGNQRNLLVDGWSADSQFLSINEQTQTADTDTVWATANLNESRAVFKAGAWSPQGSFYSGVRTNSNGNDEIVLWSPEKDLPTGYVLAPKQVVELINWSPDGRYFAVQSHVDCVALVYCVQRWSYDIFSSSGKLVASDIYGKEWSGASSVPTAVWSTDGEKWVFLQQSQQNGSQIDLVAWRAADNRTETIAANLDSSLTPDMFYTAASRRFNGGPFLSTVLNQPTGNRLIIRTQHDGKIKIEVADLDGSNRTTLVDNADQILFPQQSTFASQQFWSIDGGLITIVWTTGTDSSRQVHLTWARADGSSHFEISDGIQSIDSLQIMRPGSPGNQKRISYMAMRGGVEGIEMAELATGKHYRLITGTKSNDSWSISPSANGQTVALVLQNYYTSSFQNELYLVSFDGEPPRKISQDMLGLPSWSPDGLTVAFLEQDTTRSNYYINLTGIDGTPIKTLPVAPSEQQVLSRFNRNQTAVYNWTTCS